MEELQSDPRLLQNRAGASSLGLWTLSLKPLLSAVGSGASACPTQYPSLGPACPGHQQSHQGWQAQPEGQGSGVKGDRRPSSTICGLS